MNNNSESTARAKSQIEYAKYYRFMTQDLNLSGVELLVYSRVFSFRSAGYPYYESKEQCAQFINASKRGVIKAFDRLIEKRFIIYSGTHISKNGRQIKSYVVNREPLKDIGLELSKFSFCDNPDDFDLPVHEFMSEQSSPEDVVTSEQSSPEVVACGERSSPETIDTSEQSAPEADATSEQSASIKVNRVHLISKTDNINMKYRGL